MVEFLSSLLFVVDVIVAVLLIAIIMIQQSKSGGGIGAISGGGGGMGESVLGPAAGNIITKTTVILASVFLLCTLFLAILSQYRSEDVSIAEKIQKQEQEKAVKNAVGEDSENTSEKEGKQPDDLTDSGKETSAGEQLNTDTSSPESEGDSSAEDK